MKHLKVDICRLLLRGSAFVSQCVCAGFFHIPSYLFDLVLCAALFLEVIGELVIGDQLDSSWLMTEPRYQGKKLALLKSPHLFASPVFTLERSQQAGLNEDKSGNKISNRQMSFHLSILVVVKTRTADAMVTSCWRQYSSYRLAYPHWCLDSWWCPRNNACRFLCDSSVLNWSNEACLASVHCFALYYSATLQAAFCLLELSHFLLT